MRLRDFCKMFYICFFGKTFYKFLRIKFYQRKIFYNFDHILHAIKHLKMRKYFIENIFRQNKQSEISPFFHI